MAQQTTPTTTTIIQDLQSASFKILELSKKYEIPEKDVIEVNDYLLKIYKKVNNPTTQPTPTPPQEPQGPPPPLNQANQANLTYTYTYAFNNNNNNNNNNNSNVNTNTNTNKINNILNNIAQQGVGQEVDVEIPFQQEEEEEEAEAEEE